MSYEYSTVLDAFKVDLDWFENSDLDDARRSIYEGQVTSLTKLNGEADSLTGGGWELLSMDHLLIADKVFVTYFLRRQK